MRTIETNVYQIDEHPNKAKCYEWIRANWYDLNAHGVDEVVKSIKKLSEIIGGTVDYAISQFPDRGEYIRFKNYDNVALCHISADDCPLTGCSYDIDVITNLREGTPSKILTSIHNETKYMYSDEGLNELCKINEYEFTIDGEQYSD